LQCWIDAAETPVFQALNQGTLEAMGVSLGIREAFGQKRSRELGNHCLWCDEFFSVHAPDLLNRGGITERATADLVQIGWPISQADEL